MNRASHQAIGSVVDSIARMEN